MVLGFVSVLVASLVSAASGESRTPAIEVAPPPAAYATDVSTLREAAAAEIQTLEAVVGTQRRVVVSLALAVPSSDAPNACEVDATLRDERTGAVLAYVETSIRMTGNLSPDQRRALAQAAVRSATRRVTAARVAVR